jgi:hypothetical protein
MFHTDFRAFYLPPVVKNKKSTLMQSGILFARHARSLTMTLKERIIPQST